MGEDGLNGAEFDDEGDDVTCGTARTSQDIDLKDAKHELRPAVISPVFGFVIGSLVLFVARFLTNTRRARVGDDIRSRQSSWSENAMIGERGQSARLNKPQAFLRVNGQPRSDEAGRCPTWKGNRRMFTVEQRADAVQTGSLNSVRRTCCTQRVSRPDLNTRRTHWRCATTRVPSPGCP